MESDISVLLAENDSRHSDRTQVPSYWLRMTVVIATGPKTLQVTRVYLSNNTLTAHEFT